MEEGEIIIGNSPWKIREFLEKFRWAFVKNESVEFFGGSGNVYVAENIILSNGVVFDKLVFYPKKAGAFTINPSAQNYQEYPEENDMVALYFDDDKLRIRVKANQKNELLDFLYPSYSDWIQNYYNLINHDDRDFSIKYLNRFPRLTLSEVNLEHRKKFLEKLAAGSMTELGAVNEELLACEIINFTPPQQSEELINVFRNEDLFDILSDKIDNWGGLNYYTLFIKRVLKVFYNQPQEYFEDNYLNGKVITWHKPGFNPNYGDWRYSVNYDITELENRNLKIIQTISRSKAPSSFQEFELEPININYFSVINVHFSSSPEFLPIEAGSVLPLPAFFFKWIVDEHTDLVIEQGASLAISMASFSIGLNELIVARDLENVLAIVGLVHQAGDLCFNHPEIKSKLVNILGANNFMVLYWNEISFAISLNLINVKILDDIPVYFDSFTQAWNAAKQNDDVWNQINLQLTQEEIELIRSFVNAINE